MDGSVAIPDLGGPELMGRRGSRLILFVDLSDGARVEAFASSTEWSSLPDASDILSRCGGCCDESCDSRTTSAVESAAEEMEPAVDGRGKGGVADKGGSG